MAILSVKQYKEQTAIIKAVLFMREWKKIIPASPDDDLDERFDYALHHFDYAEYLCDEFFKSDKNGRADMENCVSEIADFLSRLG